METLFRKLIISGKHLYLLDKALRQNYKIYYETSKKLESIALFKEFLREIYAGGKKGGRHGFERQMILGDLLEYILTGRGYYFAVKGKDYIESFVKIIMYVCNLLILMEDSSVDVKLRNKIIITLEKGLKENFVEDKEQELALQKLKEFEGKILPGVKGGHEDFFDSLFPKRVGCVPELLVYVYLIRKRYGYVVPLLTLQRLLGNQSYIIPPDFLLLRSKGEIFGIEVGTHKERQITTFSTITSIPVFTVGLGSPEQPQPYRCGKCQRWIIYCDKVIEYCSKNQDMPDQEYLDCNNCDQIKKCPFIVYHGKAHDHSGKVRELRYHYNCVKGDPIVKKVIGSKRYKKPKLIAPLPWVSGLESIKEES